MTRDRIFLLGTASFIIGIYIFPYAEIDLWVLFMLSGALVALLFLLTDENAKILIVLALCLIVGLVRFESCEKLSDVEGELAALDGKKVSLECEVAGMPEFKNGKQQITLSVKDEDFPDGKILAFVSAYGDYSHGDVLEFEGKLKLPESFEDFDYRAYLFRKNIYFVSYYPELKRVKARETGLYSAIYAVRKQADRNLTGILPSPEGNILSAMTLGMNSDEIKEVMEDFNTTGTSHVIVVSGSHLVIVIAILMYIFFAMNINRNKIFYLVLAGMACFIVMSGSGASAIRSGIMALVFLLAVRLGRSKKALNALMFSAAVMIFWKPSILMNDVGFQLSFLATFGIVCVVPVISNGLKKLPKAYGLKDILIATLSAQLMTLPVIAINFGQFSFLSFLANILILPTVPLLMAGGFFTVALSFFSLDLARVAALPLYFLLRYCIEVVEILSGTDIGLIKF